MLSLGIYLELSLVSKKSGKIQGSTLEVYVVSGPALIRMLDGRSHLSLLLYYVAFKSAFPNIHIRKVGQNYSFSFQVRAATVLPRKA